MKVKLSDSAYKHILSEKWVSARADEALIAWMVNRALASVGHPPMFDIDDTNDTEEALVLLAPASDGYGGRDALCILYPDIDLKFVEEFDSGDVQAVHRRKDGRLLGFLTTYRSNNGRGRLSGQDFKPAPGVRVYYDD